MQRNTHLHLVQRLLGTLLQGAEQRQTASGEHCVRVAHLFEDALRQQLRLFPDRSTDHIESNRIESFRFSVLNQKSNQIEAMRCLESLQLSQELLVPSLVLAAQSLHILHVQLLCSTIQSDACTCT